MHDFSSIYAASKLQTFYFLVFVAGIFPTRQTTTFFQQGGKKLFCEREFSAEKSNQVAIRRHTGIVEPEKMRIDAGKKLCSFEEGKSKCFSSTSCWKSVDSRRRKFRTRIFFIRLSVSAIQFAAGSLFRRELHPSKTPAKIIIAARYSPLVKQHFP